MTDGLSRLLVGAKVGAATGTGAADGADVGASDGWPNGSYAQRTEIFSAHREYTLGLFHFLRTDPSVGSQLKEDIAQWGALSHH